MALAAENAFSYRLAIDFETLPSSMCEFPIAQKKGPPPKEWPVKSGRKRPLKDFWDQAAACSIGEKGRPRLSATAL